MRVGVNALALRGGGGYTYLRHLLRHLGALPARPDCLIVGPPHALQRLAPDAGWAEMLVAAPRSLAQRLWWEQVRLPALLRRRAVDVLLAPHNVGLLRATPPAVVTIQNVEPLAAGPREAGVGFRLRMTALRVLTLATARRAARVIAISDYVRQLLVGRVGPKVRVEVIPLGRPDDADLPLTARAADAPRRRGLVRPYLLAVSSVKYNKNYARMIEAFAAAELNGVELAIAGGVEHRWAYEAARAAARRHRVEDRVRFLGNVEGDDLRGLYDGAIALIFPSLLESFGLPALEAMSYGVPVAAADIPPLREMCREAAVYVDPYGIPSMAAGMRRLATDPTLRRRLADEGRRRAREFDWPDIARRTWDLLAAAAKGA